MSFNKNIAYNLSYHPVFGWVEQGQGGGIHVSQIGYNQRSVIESNSFFNNQSVDGAIYVSTFRVLVINNIIANNHGTG